MYIMDSNESQKSFIQAPEQFRFMWFWFIDLTHSDHYILNISYV